MNHKVFQIQHYLRDVLKEMLILNALLILQGQPNTFKYFYEIQK
jgi:hypothetical protein